MHCRPVVAIAFAILCVGPLPASAEVGFAACVWGASRDEGVEPVAFRWRSCVTLPDVPEICGTWHEDSLSSPGKGLVANSTAKKAWTERFLDGHPELSHAKGAFEFAFSPDPGRPGEERTERVEVPFRESLPEDACKAAGGQAHFVRDTGRLAMRKGCKPGTTDCAD